MEEQPSNLLVTKCTDLSDFMTSPHKMHNFSVWLRSDLVSFEAILEKIRLYTMN